MATYKLFLLPGDGIGPEVMAEVEKVAAFLGQAGIASFEMEKGLVGGCAYDAHGQSISEEHMAMAQAADAVIFGAVGGPEMGRRALRRAPRGGPAAPAQGSRTVRQPAPRDLLSRARRRVLAEARDRREPRHHDRARADRRRLFRRAQADHRSGQRPEARHRHAGLRHLRDRAHRPRRLRAGAQAPQQGDLVRKAQRDEVRRAVARSDVGAAQARISRTWSWSISSPTRSACSSCAGPSSST